MSARHRERREAINERMAEVTEAGEEVRDALDPGEPTPEDRAALDEIIAEGPPEPRPEGNVPAGTRELRVVLKDVAEEGHPPDYRFIELEDQDRHGVGGFEWVEDGDYKMLVIPYGRDDEWVTEVAMQAAGAASVVFLMAHPDDVMPTEGVIDAVQSVLAGFGVGSAPAQRDAFSGWVSDTEIAMVARESLVRLIERDEISGGALLELVGGLTRPYPGEVRLVPSPDRPGPLRRVLEWFGLVARQEDQD